MGVRLTGFTLFGTLSDGLHTPSSAQRQHAILESGGNTPGIVKQNKSLFSIHLHMRHRVAANDQNHKPRPRPDDGQPNAAKATNRYAREYAKTAERGLGLVHFFVIPFLSL